GKYYEFAGKGSISEVITGVVLPKVWWPQRDFPRKRLCHRRQGDSVSELLEAMDVVIREALGCQPVEVIRAEVTVGNPFTQNVISGHEDAVAHRDRRFFLTTPPAQARILSAEIGTPGAAGSPAAFHEQRLEPPIALAGLACLALASALIVPGADASPRGQMRRRRKPTHVDADFCNYRLRSLAADAGNGLQARHVTSIWAHGGLHPLVQSRDGRLQIFDVR